MKVKNVLQNLFIGLIGLAILTPALTIAQVTIKNPIKYNNFCSLLTEGIIPAVAGIIGALGTLMIVVAGFLFMTSAGSPEKVKSAKTALFYAIMGILIALLASGIVATVKSILGATGNC